ncbi:MAG: SGNH/GDSL hydrolase family protein [Bacteroidia bacterium]|nr:SGNH/GDSL hydrolase family protein [Bacteroidia bacterium]
MNSPKFRIAILSLAFLTAASTAFFLLPLFWNFSLLLGGTGYELLILVGLILLALLLLFRFRSKKGLLGFLLFLILILFWETGFLVLENQWRKQGAAPGMLTGTLSRSVEYSDSVYYDSLFIADESGIMKANPRIWNSPHNEFARENHYSINSEGFRSVEFLPDSLRDSSKTTLLLLGDSFTWGSSADPIDSCFADRLSQAGYQVYNTGIGGTDPLQYLLVAQKYLPRLRPDRCLLFYALDNDQMRFPRKPIPFMPLYYSTNAGGISAYTHSCIDGKWNEPQPLLSAERAWQSHVKLHTLFGKNRGFFAEFCRKTVLGTQIWKVFRGCQACAECQEPELDYSLEYLQKISLLCQSLQIPFQIYLIPNSNDTKFRLQESRRQVSMLREYFGAKIPDLDSEDYFHEIDFHLNNRGHRKFARFILQNLPSQPQIPSPHKNHPPTLND